MKEGRKPVPGPPGGDKDLSILSNTSGEYVSGMRQFLFGEEDGVRWFLVKPVKTINTFQT